jgi:AraC-like DNA-binding protein
MLWIDCVSSTRDPALRARAAEFFQVHHCERLEQATSLIEQHRPGVIVFDFDYPLESQLRAMQTIKRSFMGIPILMLTVEHSEALAVWSFRARVWNYLVKPVVSQEWRANLQALAKIAVVGPRQRRAVRLPGPALADLSNPSRADASYAAILPAIEQIERNYSAPISATELAKLCGMSPFRFSREFHRAIGTTFQDHLLRYRVSEACRLLRQQPDMAIAEIGFAVGFNDNSYFARIFKRYMNMRPSEFIRAQASVAEPLPEHAGEAVRAAEPMPVVAAHGRRAGDRRRSERDGTGYVEPPSMALPLLDRVRRARVAPR